MLDSVTKRRINDARDILVGKIPDPKSQVEQITIALIYKFMYDMDQQAVEMGGKATFFSGDYAKYAWNNIFDPRLSGYKMLALYVEAVQRMNLNPNLPQFFRDVFKNAYLPFNDPETLKLFLKTINEFTYNHSEDLGNAFEYLLSVLGSQGDAGQFRTPRHLIDFMVQVVKPQKNETVLDPACGTAGFLISAYKHILADNRKNQPGDLLTPDERKQLLRNFKGYDISPDMVRLSLVNMFLHGFAVPPVYEYDTLTSQERWDEYADVILANPPFMSPKGGIKPHKRFSVQSNRSEILFVDYMAEHLTPTGRAAIIVPEGIIFQSNNAYKQLRRHLVEKNYLWAVVSLPAGIFQPYSGVKTSILFLDRELAKKTDQILFVKVEADGYDLGAQRKPVERNDLPGALTVIEEWQKAVREGKSEVFNSVTQVCAAALVENSKLAKNGDYNLSAERYQESVRVGGQKWPFVALSSVCTRITDGSHFSPKTIETGFPYITVRDIDNGKIDFDHCHFITREDFEKLKKNNCKPEINDVLFSKDGTVGKVALVDFEKDFVVLSSIAILTPDKAQIIPEYLRAILASNQFIKKATDNKTGMAIRRIILRTISEMLIPLPPIEVQREIVEEIARYQKIIDNVNEIIKLHENNKQKTIERVWEE